MNCNEEADQDFHLISRKENMQKHLVLEVLKLSDCSLYQDVTLLCSDGSEKLNIAVRSLLNVISVSRASDLTYFPSTSVFESKSHPKKFALCVENGF